MTSDQQLLTAVIVRSPKKFAPEYLLLVALVTDFEADTDDVEQADWVYNRLFWAVAFLSTVSQTVS